MLGGSCEEWIHDADYAELAASKRDLDILTLYRRPRGHVGRILCPVKRYRTSDLHVGRIFRMRSEAAADVERRH